MTSCGYMALVILSVFLGTIDQSQEGCFDYLEDRYQLKNLTLIKLIEAKDSEEVINCTVESQCKANHRFMCDIRDTCFENDGVHLDKICQNKSLGNDMVPLSHFLCLMAKIFNHPIKECGDYGIICKLYSGIPSPNSFPGQPSLLPTAHTPTTPRVTNTTDPVPKKNITNGNICQTTSLSATHTPTTPQVKSSTMQQTNISDNIKASSVRETEPEKTLRSLLGISLGLNIILPVVVYLYMCHQRRIKRSHSISTSNNGCEATTSLTFTQENHNYI